MSPETKEKIDELIARYSAVRGTLQGADTSEIEAIEEKFSLKFPESYKYFLLQCDGICEQEDWFVRGVNGLKDISYCEIILEKGWIPYADDGYCLGNSYCVNCENGNTAFFNHETDAFEEEAEDNFESELIERIEDAVSVAEDPSEYDEDEWEEETFDEGEE